MYKVWTSFKTFIFCSFGEALKLRCRFLAMTLLFIGCMLSCMITVVHAQTNGFVQTDSGINKVIESTDDQAVYITDTMLYRHEINISADTISAWKKDNRYGYVKNLDSLLKIRNREDLASYQPVPDTSSSFLQRLLSSNIIQLIFWAIAAAMVFFILYKLFITNGIFRRNTAATPVSALPGEALMNDASDYDELIRQSYKLSDFRMAIRYLFLKTLWMLGEKGLVHRTPEKTNFQYLQEIPAHKKKAFASLVLSYEYIWYGHLEIKREQYDQLIKDYESFHNTI